MKSVSFKLNGTLRQAQVQPERAICSKVFAGDSGMGYLDQELCSTALRFACCQY